MSRESLKETPKRELRWPRLWNAAIVLMTLFALSSLHQWKPAETYATAIILLVGIVLFIRGKG